jgi:hypothetical protein
MPAYRTRDTRLLVDALEAPTDAPSRANSPFEPDLRTLTFAPPSPTASVSSSNGDATFTPQAPPPKAPRRRRGTVDDGVPRPKKGDAEYIKRPENAFILFRRACCEERNERESADDVGSGPKRLRQADLSKMISAQWKALSPAEREEWEARARARKAEHAAAHPDYVYRPQRTKKGKSRQQGEDITFTVPAPVAQIVHEDGKRSISPPQLQTVVIPDLCMPTPVLPEAHAELEPDWNFGSFAGSQSQMQYTKPEGWRPEAQASVTFSSGQPGFDFHAPPISIITEGVFNPGASFSMSSSGAPSPRMGPYTPDHTTRQLESEASITIHAQSSATDMWTSAPLGQQWAEPSAWAWGASATNMFDEHYDVGLIPPVALDVPKFDFEQQQMPTKYDAAHSVDPSMLHVSYGHEGCQQQEQQGWQQDQWGFGYDGFESGLAA